MTARDRYASRLRRAWRELGEALEAYRQIDDAANELRVDAARADLLRVLSGMRPIPPEVREAQRRIDEWCEDNPGPVDDAPSLMAQMEELHARYYAAEEATGYRSTRRERQQRAGDERPGSPPDDEEYMEGGWFAERRAKVWGVIQPDGTVQAKGFVGDESADDDQAVYPPGSIAYYGAGGWTNAATGNTASRGPAPAPPVTPPKAPQVPDLADLRRGRWYDDKPITTTASTGGGGMASIDEVRAGIMASNEKANEGLGAVQHAHASLEEAQGMLMRATEGSGQADVSEANGLLAQAVNDLDEVRQQVTAAISAAESVANRL